MAWPSSALAASGATSTRPATTSPTPQFDTAYAFEEELAAVEQNDRWGFVDQKGQIVINPQFDDTFGFRDGLASVQVGEKWGYIDKTGSYVINPQFEWAAPHCEGLAAFRQDDKWGAIDKKGDIVIAPRFAYPFCFDGDLAFIKEDGDEARYGYIDKTGKIVAMEVY